jgi:hypothetical protein
VIKIHEEKKKDCTVHLKPSTEERLNCTVHLKPSTEERLKCTVHLKPSTHERLMRRKKTGIQTFDNVIVNLLNENIELKRKLRIRNAKNETSTADKYPTKG